MISGITSYSHLLARMWIFGPQNIYSNYPTVALQNRYILFKCFEGFMSYECCSWTGVRLRGVRVVLVFERGECYVICTAYLRAVM
jgi:hypothetical protein